MREYVLIRLAAFAGTVLGTALVLFLVLDLVPGSGAALPIPDRALSLFGTADIWQRLAVTLPLTLIALAIAAAAGFALHRLPMRPVRQAVATTLAVLPPFWLGMLLALLVGGVLRLLPASGFVPWSSPGGALASLLLPALALGLPYAGQIALRLDSEPSTALPTILGRCFAALLLAASLVESVFYLPGLGRLVLGAAQQHDLLTLRGGLFVLVLVAATGGLIAALSRLAVEPGLRR
jgi:peptide/nickel transport system permease protein